MNLVQIYKIRKHKTINPEVSDHIQPTTITIQFN